MPPEWWAESEEDTVLIGDRDDVGVIEISTLHKNEGEFSTGEIASIASEEGGDTKKISLGDFSGLLKSLVEDAEDDSGEAIALREWYVSNGAIMLYITYSCELENQGMDDAAVDEILDTLLLLSPEG